jgi:hypothetical protein
MHHQLDDEVLVALFQFQDMHLEYSEGLTSYSFVTQFYIHTHTRLPLIKAQKTSDK